LPFQLFSLTKVQECEQYYVSAGRPQLRLTEIECGHRSYVLKGRQIFPTIVQRVSFAEFWFQQSADWVRMPLRLPPLTAFQAQIDSSFCRLVTKSVLSKISRLDSSRVCHLRGGRVGTPSSPSSQDLSCHGGDGNIYHQIRLPVHSEGSNMVGDFWIHYMAKNSSSNTLIHALGFHRRY
jgi:hypothetical protein